MKELFLPYELALLAKEKGFDEECFACYFIYDNGEITFEPEAKKYPQNNYTHYLKGIRNSIYCKRDSFADFDKVSAPLYQQIIDWFREKQGLIIRVTPITFLKEVMFEPSIYKKGNALHFPDKDSDGGYIAYKHYYEALDKAITEAFNLI